MPDPLHVMRNVRVPMRDGVTLATDVYLPPGGGAYPVALQRTPYNRTLYFDPYYPAHGIAMVAQDCRGRYDSDGDYYPFTAEREDGADTLAWIGAQPWCSGRIGMFGDSYVGAVQYAVAQDASPLLAALNPGFMSGDCWKHAYYIDGALSLGLIWSWCCFECAARVSHAIHLPRLDVPAVLRHLPLITLDEASGIAPNAAFRDYVRANRYGPVWRDLNVRDGQVDAYRTPMLLTVGWYDNYAADTCYTYRAIVDRAPTEQLRRAHRLLIGPWSHGIQGSRRLADVDFGEHACDEDARTRNWLECLLNGGRPEDVLPAPVRIFVMGANCWRDEAEWPLARAVATALYLHPDGSLRPEAPSDGARPASYTYDPADPVPTLGGNHSVGAYNPGLYELALPGPIDQRPTEARPDVLTYTTAPLDADTEVTGHVALELYASSTAPDTDFVGRLTDVHPDGRSINITEGVLRTRFRGGVWNEPALMEPGEVVRLTIDLQATSMLFRAGHRIRLQVTSSNFPLWDRNLNTGEDPATGVEMRTARQTIHHDASRPSHLVLPIIPTGSS